MVVDSDQGVSLDDAAAISRQLSAALDSAPVMGDFPYTLEVSSPGVDRPLTDPRHWRRSVGRLVQVAVTDAGDKLRGRLGPGCSGRLGRGDAGHRGRPPPLRLRRAGGRRRPGGVRAPAYRAWSDPEDIDLSVLRSLESEKDISLDQAIKAIEDALLVAYHKSEGASTAARVEVDRKSGHVTVWATRPAGRHPGAGYDDTPAGSAGSPRPPPGR